MMRFAIPNELLRILRETPELSQAYLVGGCVRDGLLDLPNKDYDVEVFGLSYEQLAGVLARWGKTDFVGRSFGVVKLTLASGEQFDFTVPRRDSKIAGGHKGFAVEFDAEIPPPAAASRRDFTINSIMYDPVRDQLLDFFGGQEDLAKRILRHTSAAFPEDPLRVLRGMQLAARFDLTVAPETVALCRTITRSYAELPGERVREEWLKWSAQSRAPSAGLRFLEASGWIAHYPELDRLRGTPQDPEWHPEGDVFVHTGHACDALVQLPEWQGADASSRSVCLLAALCHDIGKPLTTQTALREGKPRIISPGHDQAGVPLTEALLARLHIPAALVKRIVPLVAHHMAHLERPSPRAVRRLAKRLEPETIQALCLLMRADAMGRPPLARDVPQRVHDLLAQAEAMRLADTAPKPVLLGRHLLELGLVPGQPYKAILNQAFDAQLDGEFEDLAGAHAWLKNHFAGSWPEDSAARLEARLEELRSRSARGPIGPG